MRSSMICGVFKKIEQNALIHRGIKLQSSSRLTSCPAFVVKNDGVDGVDGVLTVPTGAADTTNGVVFVRSSFL